MIHQTVIGWAIDPTECDGVLIVYEDFKILSRLKMHLFPYGAGQDDLSFLRKNSGHGGKILLCCIRVAIYF